MDKRKQAKLKKKGWTVGTAADFLDLSAEESAYIEMKLALSEKLKARRIRKKLTQKQLAKAIESSQSRVAKMEAGDPTVSLDLLVKSLLVLGVSKKELRLHTSNLIVRASPFVHDSNDQDLVIDCAVDDVVRESMDDSTPNSAGRFVTRFFQEVMPKVLDYKRQRCSGTVVPVLKSDFSSANST